MEDEQRDRNVEDSAPHDTWRLLFGRVGQISRDEDEQRHVEHIDDSHDAVVDDIAGINRLDDVTQDDQYDQQSLERI